MFVSRTTMAALTIDREFSSAVKHSLSCLGMGDLVLKKGQLDAMQYVYEGKDVFVWLPTEYGKSITYQTLPFLFDYKLRRTKSPPPTQSVVLVVSPLVSLMVDQTRKLTESGVQAGILSGNTGVDKELLASDGGVARGQYRLLFSAPEALLNSDRWRHKLIESPLCNQVVAVAVDEAHCVYKW